MYYKNQENTKILKIIVVSLATFIIAYLATVAFLTLVYGYDFNNSIPYNETMNATKNAANFTEGMEIDLYIKNIENQTLGGV